MRQRPWPLVILALLHVITPVLNILWYPWIFHITIAQYWNNLMTLSLIHKAEFFCLFPLVGCAIYRVRPWTYPFIVGTAVYAMIQYIRFKAAYPTLLPTWIIVGVGVIDLGIIGYFLLPDVRKVYFNAKMRWWESQPRYQMQFLCVIMDQGRRIAGVARDFSIGGVFLAADAPLELGMERKIQFSLLERDFQLTARVVHVEKGAKAGYGLQFGKLSWVEHSRLKDVAYGLDFLGIPTRHPKEHWLSRLLSVALRRSASEARA